MIFLNYSFSMKSIAKSLDKIIFSFYQKIHLILEIKLFNCWIIAQNQLLILKII